MAIYSEFSHQKWWFSIATLNYQRVWGLYTTILHQVGQIKMWPFQQVRVIKIVDLAVSPRPRPLSQIFFCIYVYLNQFKIYMHMIVYIYIYIIL